MKITLDDIRRLDPGGMHACIAGFPSQVEEAVRIGSRAPHVLKARQVNAVVLTGMGGSAIGGDLLRSYLSDELEVPFSVNRSYGLPSFVGPKTLVIISSYSGNTEETLSSYRDAIRRGARVLCITTGGKAERLARRQADPCLKVPPGLQPRSALGYSFFPLLMVLARGGFVRQKHGDIKETLGHLRSRSRVYANPTNPRNLPLQIAQRLHGKLPIFYSASEHLDAINLRWRCQINENAKQLAFGNVLPEMNHNEIVGWNVDGEWMKRMAVVFLRDGGTDLRIGEREEITKRVIKKFASDVLEVRSEGKSLLARIFSLVYLGDWVSYYLAILNKQNPTPVKVIEYLKGELAKV